MTNSRWLAYAAAGAATALSGASSAEAEIHYSGLLNIEFKTDKTAKFQLNNKVSIDFQRFTYSDSGFRRKSLDEIVIYGVRGGGADSIAARIGRGSEFLERLEFGQLISTGRFGRSPYRAAAYEMVSERGNQGEFLARGTGFIGFRFDVGQGKQYGWARVQMMGESHHNNYILKDYAFADAGETIFAGQTTSMGDAVGAVPDSSSLGLLALGAAGLMAWRKSRFSLSG